MGNFHSFFLFDSHRNRWQNIERTQIASNENKTNYNIISSAYAHFYWNANCGVMNIKLTKSMIKKIEIEKSTTDGA